MTTLLTGNLPLLAGAPKGIQKLRGLIIELAVRGKLVVQDPSDEPAGEVLRRIAEEKAQLMADGKIKQQKPLAEVAPEDKPFSLPATWEWVRLGDSLEMINGRAFKATDWRSSGLPIVRIQNLNREHAAFNYCEESGVDERHIIDSGALLISWSGTPGTSFGAFLWTRGRAALNQHIFSCSQKGDAFLGRFLVLAINARLDELIAKAHGGVGLQHVTKGKLEALTLVVPPLAEQHRIVAKVDELMELCDRLETRRADSEAAQAHLVQVLLESLSKAADAADFDASWRRVSEHFHTLFTTEFSIDVLKRTLLQLAVMGKIEPQDPSDGQACELLKVVQIERQAAAVGKKKLDNKRALDARDDTPFELPLQWEWSCLSDLAISGPSNGYSPKPVSLETPYRCLTLSATTRGVFNDQCFKFVDIHADIASKYFLKRGDLLIQRANSIDYVGVSAIYDHPDDQFIFPDLMMRLRISGHLNPKFIHAYLSSVSGRAYFRSNASGTQGNMPKINQSTVASAPIPIPPLAEQHRIVDKIEQLMSLCDQLKARVVRARVLNDQLADALVAAAIAVESTVPASNILNLSSYLIRKLASRPTFGRTAHMKWLFLADQHLGLKLGMTYERQAAGPLDKLIYQVEEQAAQSQLYATQKETLKSGIEKIVYHPDVAIDRAADAGAAELGDKRAELDRLIGLLGGHKTEDLEIVATLYAVWNDALAEGQQPDDGWLINEFRTNWYKGKERFSPELLAKWLSWMREHRLVPAGKISSTRHQGSLLH